MNNLLEPIATNPPCGEDLSYDPVYHELGVLIEGTPEDPFLNTAAKEPSWRDICEKSEGALRRSMDLQIAVYYALALVRMDGLDGAAQGLELIAGMVQNYWEKLYPELDATDPESAQLRVRIVQQISVPVGGYTSGDNKGVYRDPIKFVERLCAAPLLTGTPIGVVPLGYLSQKIVSEAGKLVPGAALLGNILSDMKASERDRQVANAVGALKRISIAAHAIDDALVRRLTSEMSADLKPLTEVADQGLKAFQSSGANDGGQADTGIEIDEPDASGVAETLPPGLEGGAEAALEDHSRPAAVVRSGPKGGSGAIQSTADVSRALDKICEFYAATEPSSPVPVLLRRAQRLIGKNFFDLLEDLAPSGQDEFVKVAGIDGKPKG